MTFLKPLRMMLSVKNTKGNYYRKSLILVLLITSLPMAAITISNYFIGISQIKTEVYHKNKYQLEQVFQRLDEQFSQLELTLVKWSSGTVFDEKLREADFSSEIAKMHDIYSALSILQGTNPMIGRIDLFLSNQHLLVSNDKGAVTLEGDTEQLYESILNRKDNIFWTTIAEAKGNDSSLFPFVLVHKIPITSTRPFGELLVYLDKKQIDKEISQLNPYENSVSFIVRPDGQWVTAGTAGDPDELELKALIRDKMTQMDNSSASFAMKWKGTEYSVAYETFSRTGWRYMIATPISQLTASISFASKLMLAVSLIGMMLAGWLSWFASQRIYKPIRRLVHLIGDGMGGKHGEEDKSDEIQFIENKWTHVTRESRFIQSLLEENQSNMQRAFVLQLVQGQLNYYSETELRERLEEYGWDTRDKGFVLLLIQLSPFADDSKRFVEGDEQLVTFAVSNIMEELSKEQERMQVINFHNLSVAMLLSFERHQTGEQIKSEVFKFSDEMIEVIHKLLGIHVAAGVSKVVYTIKGLPAALDEVRQCLHFRNVGEHGQILSVDDFMPHGKGTLDYPFSIEKELVQALQMGLEQETMDKLDEFMRVLEHNTGTTFQMQQYMAQLLGSVLRALIQLGVMPESIHQGVNLYDQLFLLREPNEMNHWFKTRLIRPSVKALSEKKGIEIKQTIQKVMDIINEEYMKDISLEYLSEQIGVYPKRLSALFAEVTGSNFIEYVTGIRLQKSKELLKQTDLKVNDIAARVGYQPSYFNKVFKKSEGMTPGEYRELDLKL